MSLVRTVVICSAGMGTRLGLNIPKCLVSVAGRPIIHWQLDLLDDFDNIIVVVGHHASSVMRAVIERRPNAAFVINHDYRMTSTLDSLHMGVRELTEPFVYLDGDLLIDQRAVNAVRESPWAAAGIKRTYSDQPVCVEYRESRYGKQITAFTRESRDYEWTGLAQLTPAAVLEANGSPYVYHALEKILPVAGIEIECSEIDTLEDLERAETWIERKTGSRSSGRIALTA